MGQMLQILYCKFCAVDEEWNGMGGATDAGQPRGITSEESLLALQNCRLSCLTFIRISFQPELDLSPSKENIALKTINLQ